MHEKWNGFAGFTGTGIFYVPMLHCCIDRIDQSAIYKESKEYTRKRVLLRVASEGRSYLSKDIEDMG